MMYAYVTMGILELLQNIDAIGAGIIGIVVTAVISGTAFLLRRFMMKGDFEQQQNLQHSLWLLQKNHAVASDHYVPLTKFAYEALLAMKYAAKSKSNQDIKTAFYYLFIFLGKYVKFEMVIGANILFIGHQKEKVAIKKIYATMIGLPFSRLDINSIFSEFTALDEKLDAIPYDDVIYDSFAAWIRSDECARSRELVWKKLKELQGILDDESEKLLQSEYFLQHRNTNSISKRAKQFADYEQDYLERIKQYKNNSDYYIIHVTPKYAKRNDKISVFGGGFKLTETYQFYIGKNAVNHTQTKINENETMFELTIPTSIPDGTYDVYSIRTKPANSQETIGIPVHIVA